MVPIRSIAGCLCDPTGSGEIAVIRHRPRFRQSIASVSAAIMMAAGCETNEAVHPMPPKPSPETASTAESGGPSVESAPPPSSDPGRLRVELKRVAPVRRAVALVDPPLGDGLLVASREGRVYRLRNGRASEVLNLVSQTACCEGEQGMLGLAVSPDGSAIYVSFIDQGGDLKIVEFLVRSDRIAVGSRRDLLRIHQPSVRHHGGHLAFGPDGFLYIGVGDGSLGSDPTDQAQALDSLRGKLLRIDPDRGGHRSYGIPRSNPFVGQQGTRSEIYAYGLRNPWRFSFDRATGDLWVGDVGQYRFEEIDFLPSGSRAGANLGWSRLEGTERFTGEPPKRHVLPILDYPHTGGRCAVIGGYVYRGSRIPAIRAGYVFGDFCDGRLRVLFQRRGRVRRLRVLGPRLSRLTSFGEDADGEVYALSLTRGVFRLEPAD